MTTTTITEATRAKLRDAGRRGMGHDAAERHRRAVLAGRLSRATQTLARAQFVHRATGTPPPAHLYTSVRVARARLLAHDAKRKAEEQREEEVAMRSAGI